MITLNPFVDNNKARINMFLNNLCEVGDFYDTLEVRKGVRTPCDLHVADTRRYNRWTSTWRFPRKIW